MAFVLMKIFEENPRRFDRLMQILTFGQLQRIRDQVTETLVEPGTTVLEIGCGTGSLLKQLSEQGTSVAGIDTADRMVHAAREKLRQAGLAHFAEIHKLHALQVEDEFEPGSFDRVVSILTFSELSDDEVDCLLPQCRLVLKPGGRLILVDEVVPEAFPNRVVYHIYRQIARLVTYLGLQAVDLTKARFLLKVLYFLIELPLMLLAFLVVPPVTRPLKDIEGRVERAGFRLVGRETFLIGSLKLVQAETPA